MRAGYVAAGMLAAVALSGAAPGSRSVPASVVVATGRGVVTVPVRVTEGHPAVAAPRLEAVLPLSSRVERDWAVVELSGQAFEFLLDGPAFLFSDRMIPLVGGAYMARDTLFLPLQWLTEYVPRLFGEMYHYDPFAARFEESRMTPVIRTPGKPAPVTASKPKHHDRLLQHHTVVIDPGHGGPDAGTLGRFFPRGVNEKHVVLKIARELERELKRRGVGVIMTRTRDTLVSLNDRGEMCRAECDLFVSIHVDALDRGPGYQRASGPSTFFLAEAQTENAKRVAAMENSALRYEARVPGSDPLGFILRDLQENAFLRESAELAEIIQTRITRAHPGRDRGVNQANFAVLRAARRPAVLIEVGFGTNPSDARFLNSRKGQRKLARAIADGIVEYLIDYENKVLSGDDE